jgi:hypothetical protein
MTTPCHQFNGHNDIVQQATLPAQHADNDDDGCNVAMPLHQPYGHEHDGWRATSPAQQTDNEVMRVTRAHNDDGQWATFR